MLNYSLCISNFVDIVFRNTFFDAATLPGILKTHSENSAVAVIVGLGEGAFTLHLEREVTKEQQLEED